VGVAGVDEEGAVLPLALDVVSTLGLLLDTVSELPPVGVYGGPVVVPLSTPEHGAPADFVVPPEYTVGPGTT
jgi:hypothetical protein